MDPELARLRDDLATVRFAAGIEPTWNRGAVRSHVLLAAAGIVVALWAIVPHGLPPLLGMIAFAVPVAEWLWQVHGRPDRGAAEAQEWRDALAVFWYVLPITAFIVWSRVAGLSLITAGGVIWFMLGFVLFGAAVSERRLRPLLGWAIACMAAGLVAPLAEAWITAVLGLSIAVGAAISGVWIAVALRAEAR